MNERPTPETDAEHAQFAMGGFTLDFCRKLERERDEARESIVGWENKWKCAVEMAAQAEVERDEAWACCDELVVDSNAITLAKTVMRLERERDEARELCRELIDLVAYGLGQSGQEWSLDAMRQAREKIQKAKSLEAK